MSEVIRKGVMKEVAFEKSNGQRRKSFLIHVSTKKSEIIKLLFQKECRPSNAACESR